MSKNNCYENYYLLGMYLELEMPIISGGAPLAQDLISRDVS